MAFLKKHVNTNPRRGPFHLRSPSKIFWRAVRGMLPHKTKRGAEALGRLKVFEGIPAPYDKIKRMVVPDALKVLRLKPGRRWCVLGRLASEVGWRYADTIQTLEAKRKVRSSAFHNRKTALTKLKAKALAASASKLTNATKVLEQYGHA